MARETNNEILKAMADSVDPAGATTEREFNNDLLKRIADNIGSGGGSIDPDDYEAIARLINNPEIVSEDAPTAITLEDNTEYHLTNVSDLTITYPSGAFDCWLSISTASGTVTVSLPSSSYIGDPPTFGPSETWELSIRNGVVVAGKAVPDAS